MKKLGNKGTIKFLILLIIFLIQATAYSQENFDDLIYYKKGEIPLFLSAPHGGSKDIPNSEPRTIGKKDKDLRTYEITKKIAEIITNKHKRNWHLSISFTCRISQKIY